LLGGLSGNADISLASTTVTNNGTLVMDSTTANYSLIASGTLANNAAFQIVAGAGGTRYLRVPVTNSATGTVSITSTDVRQDLGTLTTNNGTVTTSASAVLAL